MINKVNPLSPLKIGQIIDGLNRLEPTPWAEVSGFSGGWAQFDTAGAWRRAKVRKVGDEVQLRGLISSGTIGAGGFTLDVGFRPADNIHFPVISNNAFGEVVVFSSGLVQPVIGSNVWVDLGPVRFSVNA